MNSLRVPRRQTAFRRWTRALRRIFSRPGAASDL